MARTIFIILLCFLAGKPSFSQKKHTYKSAFLINPAIGFNFQTNKIANGVITDRLISDNHLKFFWQPISVSFFITDHWGIEFDIRPGALKSRPANATAFNKYLDNTYQDKYYVSGTNGIYDDAGFMEGTEKIYLGIAYIIEKGKFILIPKLLFTESTTRTEYAYATLKEKNSNNIVRISYTPGSTYSKGSFTVVPGISVGYRISKRVSLNFEVLCAFYKTNITYKEEIADGVTDISSVKQYKYKQFVSTLSTGAGLIIALKKKKWNRGQ